MRRAELLKSRTMSDLVEMLVKTKQMEKNMATFTLRGWILDEIQSRDEDGFNAWIDHEEDYKYDEAITKYVAC